MKKHYEYKEGTIDQKFIPKDFKFGYHCEHCGECCRHIQAADKALLSVIDVYRLAKSMGLSHNDFIAKYCDMVPGSRSMLPLLTLKTRMDGSCILLKSGSCSAYENKPLACSLFPLGRMLFKVDDDPKDDRMDFRYFLKEFDCKATTEEQTSAQEILDEFDIEEYDECMKVYTRLANFSTQLMHNAKSDNERKELFMLIFFLLFVKYEINIDLQPQIEMNLAYLQSIYKGQAFDKASMN